MAALKYSQSTSRLHRIRQLLNRNQWVTAIVAVTVMVVSAWVYLTWNHAKTPRAFYTIDDGKTFFQADYQIPPFTKEGSEAVQAAVYSCDGGATKFVGYLLRYTPEGKKGVENQISTRYRSMDATPFQVKRPGDAQWVDSPKNTPNTPPAQTMDPEEAKFNDILNNVPCPDGHGKPVEVHPD